MSKGEYSMIQADFEDTASYIDIPKENRGISYSNIQIL